MAPEIPPFVLSCFVFWQLSSMQYTLLQHCLGLSQLPTSAERYATNVDGWVWSIRYSCYCYKVLQLEL